MGSLGSTQSITDVLIVGGSHAGLSAALTLCRALHTTIIFDSGTPRNSVSTPTHLTPSWEHADPRAFRKAAREELLRYGLVEFVNRAVESIKKTENGHFEVTDNDKRQWLGRKLLLATGVQDVFPIVEGYEGNWTKSIFPCMFQFGYEQRGADSAGVLALDGLANVFHATKLADDAHKFTRYITVYTNGNEALASEMERSLEAKDVKVDDRKIMRLVKTGKYSEVTIEFENGETSTNAFLVHRPLSKLDISLPQQLGLDLSLMGEIKVTPPFHQTSIEGVFAAGDCASPLKIIPNAITMGSYAGAGIARELPKRVTENVAA